MRQGHCVPAFYLDLEDTPMFNKLLTDTAAARSLKATPLDNSAGTVLLKLMFCVNRKNIIKGSPHALIEEIGVSLWEFNKGIKVLKKRDIIRKYTKQEYMINPDILGNGDDKHQYVLKYMWETQTLGRDKS